MSKLANGIAPLANPPRSVWLVRGLLVAALLAPSVAISQEDRPGAVPVDRATEVVVATREPVPLFERLRVMDPAPRASTTFPVLAAWETRLHRGIGNRLLRATRERVTRIERMNLEIELEPGVILRTAASLRMEPGATHIRAGGTLQDDFLVNLVAMREGTRGMVFADGRVYDIAPGSRPLTLVVSRLDPSRFPEEAEPTLVEGRSDDRPPTTSGIGIATHALTAGPHVHRVLVAYTDDVAAAFPAALSGIQAAIDMANVTYENSGIELRLELADAMLVDYDESNDTGVDLDRIKGTNDGQLDQVHARRDRVAADLVALVVNDAGDKCGKANLHSVSSDADDDSAFAVVDFSCFSNSSFTHELGHIAGAHHNTGNDPTPLPEYAHGWTKDDQFSSTSGWRSTMAYNTGGCSDDLGNCPRFPLSFSNPDRQVGGKPAGGERSNNARRLDETAQTLAGFRIDGPRISLYEGSNGTQDHVCVVDVGHADTTVFDATPNPRNCDNDEARSARLFEVPTGRIVRLFDSPEGSREDDWLEITAKRDIVEALIPGFQRSYEDADVRVVYHRNNGLDGKVSRLESADGGSGPRMALYEGNEGSQNLVCTLNIGQQASVAFQGHPECDNDEARSAVLFDARAGTVIRLYDSPRGLREDDWVELVVERDISEARISTFERSTQWSGVRATYHRNNGLDGKVSLVEIDTSGGGAGPMVTLKEGNGGSQNTVCQLGVAQAMQLRFPGHPECDNDEARSMLLHDVPAGTTFLLFDDPNRSLQDDWTAVRTKRPVATRTISSFESTFSDTDLDVLHMHNNGLDGKVSRFEVSLGGDLGGVLTLREGNNATQNKVCDLLLRNGETRFRGHGDCDNDEARSMVLSLARAGAQVSLFDSPDCRTNDDFTIVRLKRDVFVKTIGSFQRSFDDDDVEVDYHHDNGLDGKVSCVRISTP